MLFRARTRALVGPGILSTLTGVVEAQMKDAFGAIAWSDVRKDGKACLYSDSE
jgi:hypothetical protein